MNATAKHVYHPEILLFEFFFYKYTKLKQNNQKIELREPKPFSVESE